MDDKLIERLNIAMSLVFLTYDNPIYPNQCKAALKAVASYISGKRYVIINGECQSGKTDTIIFTMLLMCHFRDFLPFPIDSSMLMSGLNDIMLGNQWRNKLDGFAVPDEHKEFCWGPLELTKRFRADPSAFRDCFIVHDESYRNTSNGSKMEEFFIEAGIDLTNNDVKMRERNLWYMSVCATPFAELIENDNNQQDKVVIFLKPGNGYVGVEKMRESNIIREALRYEEKTISDLADTLNNDFTNFRESCGSEGIGIMRVNSHKNVKSKHIDVIKRVAAVLNATLVYFTSSDDGVKNEEIDELLDTKQSKRIILVIYNKFGLGKNLNKSNLAFGYEFVDYDKQKRLKRQSDSVIQGLVGRWCGYHQNPFQAPVYCDLHTVDSYINYLHSKDSSAVPNNSMHVKKGSAKGEVDRVSVYPFVFECKTAAKFCGYAKKNNGTLSAKRKEALIGFVKCSIDKKTVKQFNPALSVKETRAYVKDKKSCEFSFLNISRKSYAGVKKNFAKFIGDCGRTIGGMLDVSKHFFKGSDNKSIGNIYISLDPDEDRIFVSFYLPNNPDYQQLTDVLTYAKKIQKYGGCPKTNESMWRGNQDGKRDECILVINREECNVVDLFMEKVGDFVRDNGGFFYMKFTSAKNISQLSNNTIAKIKNKFTAEHGNGFIIERFENGISCYLKNEKRNKPKAMEVSESKVNVKPTKWQISVGNDKFDYHSAQDTYLTNGEFTINQSKGNAPMKVIPKIGDEVVYVSNKTEVLTGKVMSDEMDGELHMSENCPFVMGEQEHQSNKKYFVVKITGIGSNERQIGNQRTWIKYKKRTSKK